MISDPTQRFSDRVDDYRRFRPGYPAAMMDWLRSEHGVAPGWLAADIGAGTGISSELLLGAGLRVIAVEPNQPMRDAADAWLGANPDYRSIAATAEATALPDHSLDLITSAQAFHWFDPERTRREWQRVLKPGGLVAQYANCRRLAGTPFLEGYERLLLDHGIDYVSVSERYPDDRRMRDWFGEGWRACAVFPNPQRIDFETLRGRLLSSSYVPRPGHPGHDPMMAALRALFEATAVDGRVGFDYDTIVHVGTLTGQGG